MAKTSKKTAKKATAAKTPAKKTAKKAAVAKPAAKKAPAKKKAAKKSAAAKTPAKKTPAKPSARERGVTVEAYVAKLPAPHRLIAERLIGVVNAVLPRATASIKWGQPVFEHGGPMIWMKSFAKHFGFGFWRGAELPDPKGLLEGDGDRMRHVKLRDLNAIDEPALRALVVAAAAANKAKGNPTARATKTRA